MNKVLVLLTVLLTATAVAKGGDAEDVKAVEKHGGKVRIPVPGGFTDIDLTGCETADEAMEVLGGLKTRLQYLDLSRSKVTHRGMKMLGECAVLRVLLLNDTRVTDDWLGELPVSNQMKELQLAGTGITAEGLRALKRFKNLARLTISNPTQDRLEAVNGLKGVVAIRIRIDKETSVETFKMLKDCPKLMELQVNRGELTADHFTALKGCAAMRLISVTGMKVGGDASKALGSLKQVTSLVLDRADLVISDSKDFEHLGYLALTSSPISQQAAKQIGGMKRLSGLKLEGCTLDDKGLVELKTLGNLNTLDLSGTKVTDEGIQELKEMKHLQWLFLKKTSVTQDGARKLKNSLPETHIITQ